MGNSLALFPRKFCVCNNNAKWISPPPWWIIPVNCHLMDLQIIKEFEVLLVKWKRQIFPKYAFLTLVFLLIFWNAVLKNNSMSFSNLIFLESLELHWRVAVSKMCLWQKLYCRQVRFTKENNCYSIKHRKKKYLILLATKLIEKIHDASSAKEYYYQSFLKNENKNSVKWSKIITQQPKLWKTQALLIQNQLFKTYKNSYKFSKTIRQEA